MTSDINFKKTFTSPKFKEGMNLALEEDKTDWHYWVPSYPREFCEEALLSFTSHTRKEKQRAQEFIKEWPKNWKNSQKSLLDQSEFIVCQCCGNETQYLECEHCCEPCYPVVSELQKGIPEDDKGKEEQSQFNRLMRVHRNLGHPSNRLLVQILTEARAPQSIVELARNLECPICERMKRVAPSRPANPVRAREVGEVMALDFSHHTTADGTKLMVLNIIDEASKFHVAKVVKMGKVKTHTELGNCDAETLVECLQEYIRYLKPPKVIRCDDEAVFFKR